MMSDSEQTEQAESEQDASADSLQHGGNGATMPGLCKKDSFCTNLHIPGLLHTLETRNKLLWELEKREGKLSVHPANTCWICIVRALSKHCEKEEGTSALSLWP
jgi:hypothetical protein